MDKDLKTAEHDNFLRRAMSDETAATRAEKYGTSKDEREYYPRTIPDIIHLPDSSIPKATRETFGPEPQTKETTMKVLKKENPQFDLEKNACVAVFKTHQDAEKAVRELQKSGHDMKRLSIIGTDYQDEQNVVGYYNMRDRVEFWGSRGAFWGGLWGILFGSAFFFIPGIGPLIIAGPFVSLLVSALKGAVAIGGASALSAALYSIGIPRDSILTYETSLKSHKFLLIAHGTPQEVRNARDVLKNAVTDDVKLHCAADSN